LKKMKFIFGQAKNPNCCYAIQENNVSHTFLKSIGAIQ